MKTPHKYFSKSKGETYPSLWLLLIGAIAQHIKYNFHIFPFCYYLWEENVTAWNYSPISCLVQFSIFTRGTPFPEWKLFLLYLKSHLFYFSPVSYTGVVYSGLSWQLGVDPSNTKPFKEANNIITCIKIWLLFWFIIYILKVSN